MKALPKFQEIFKPIINEKLPSSSFREKFFFQAKYSCPLDPFQGPEQFFKLKIDKYLFIDYDIQTVIFSDLQLRKTISSSVMERFREVEAIKR